MGCERYRKYVGAFADGELEVKENLEFLEHVKMCPACAARVDEVATMKGVLQRVYAKVEPSESLRQRVAESLGDASADYRHRPRSGWSVQLRRLVVPVAMAAALIFAVVIWPSVDRFRPRPGSVTVVTGRIVSDVRAQHTACLGRSGGTHQAADLPLDVVGISNVLSRELKLRVLAPDLRSLGFRLVGADRCGVRGHSGAHVLYQALKKDAYLSIFTVGRLPEVVTTSNAQIFDVFVSDGGPLAVLGWHSDKASYLVCGDLPKSELLGLADQIRFADADTQDPTEPVFVRRDGD